jgi:hypothetical protein
VCAVAIIDAAPGGITTPEAPESLGLVAPPEAAPTVFRLKTSRNDSRLGTDRNWPDYQRCVAGAPPNKGAMDRIAALRTFSSA